MQLLGCMRKRCRRMHSAWGTAAAPPATLRRCAITAGTHEHTQTGHLCTRTHTHTRTHFSSAHHTHSLAAHSHPTHAHTHARTRGSSASQPASQPATSVGALLPLASTDNNRQRTHACTHTHTRARTHASHRTLNHPQLLLLLQRPRALSPGVGTHATPGCVGRGLLLQCAHASGPGTIDTHDGKHTAAQASSHSHARDACAAEASGTSRHKERRKQLSCAC
jgi:hypothetical protein